MPSKKIYEAGIHELDFLNKSQAMSYTHRCEKKFDEEIAPYCHRYRGGKGFLYKKAELKNRIENMVECEPVFTI